MEINHYFVLDLDMYCYDCEESNNDPVIYTCEYCDQDICQKCIKKDDYILCGPCSEQFLTNLITKEDIDNNKRLIQCNNCLLKSKMELFRALENCNSNKTFYWYNYILTKT